MITSGRPALAVAAMAILTVSLTGCGEGLGEVPSAPPANAAATTTESETDYDGRDRRLERLYDGCENGKARACASLYYNSPFGSEHEEFAQDRYLELMEERSADEYVAPAPQPALWGCHYSPTYNHDWHDDVVCSHGIEQHRPHLRGWDDFVTEGEIMGSAREYEQELNSQ
jgi:hypothetical protein